MQGGNAPSIEELLNARAQLSLRTAFLAIVRWRLARAGLFIVLFLTQDDDGELTLQQDAMEVSREVVKR